VAKETNRILGHADEADGIEEYDNPLPDWWLGLFWFTIVFAIAYGAHYHWIGNRSQEAEFAAEMANAEMRWPSGAESTAAFVMSEEAVAAGEQIFATNCIACHGADLQGGIGPSFQDDEWIHGYSVESVVRIVTDGVPAKGMVAWGSILGSEGINRVSAYVLARNAEYTGKSWDEIPMTAPDADEPGDVEEAEGSEAAEADTGDAEYGTHDGP
jgi:cytochrome c oxidase cbb3-type subunit 3